MVFPRVICERLGVDKREGLKMLTWHPTFRVPLQSFDVFSGLLLAETSIYIHQVYMAIVDQGEIRREECFPLLMSLSSWTRSSLRTVKLRGNTMSKRPGVDDGR